MKPQKNQSKLLSSFLERSRHTATGVIFVLAGCLLFLSALLPHSAFAGTPIQVFPSEGGERVAYFDAVLTIGRDGSVRVIETIQYAFGSGERHGIYRDIPFRYKGSDGREDIIALRDFEVTDEFGSPIRFTESVEGNSIHLKIGNPDVFVSGLRTYRISYVAQDAISAFSDFDELYWNVTGNEWTVPIDGAHAEIYFPASFAAAQLQLACYEGAFGSTQVCAKEDVSASVDRVSFRSTGSLSAGGGLTVAAGFPKGFVVVKEPRPWPLEMFVLYWPLFIPIFVFVYLIRRWSAVGKDPKGRGVVIAEYDVPEHLSPLEMAQVLRQQARPADISAEIIHLAVQGFVKIEQVQTSVLLFTVKDYRLHLMKRIDAVSAADRKILETIFPGGQVGESILISQFKKTFALQKVLPHILTEISNVLIARGYYKDDPMKVTGRYIGVGVLTLIGGIFIGIMFAALLQNAMIPFAFVIAGVLIIGFAFIMPSVTYEGGLVRERIKGFRVYLRSAEKDRIAFHNAPERRPELFERFLPYAMVLGVEEAWAKEFADMYQEPPSWYQGSAASFNTMTFASAMGDFSTAATAAVSPHSNSGSGGGGHSGGGGGGGGGGSW